VSAAAGERASERSDQDHDTTDDGAPHDAAAAAGLSAATLLLAAVCWVVGAGPRAAAVAVVAAPAATAGSEHRAGSHSDGRDQAEDDFVKLEHVGHLGFVFLHKNFFF